MKTLKTLLCMLAATSLVTSCGTDEVKSYNQGVHIIPQPKQMAIKNGSFTLKSSTRVVADMEDPQIRTVVDYFTAKIAASTGYRLTVLAEEPTSNFISIRLDTTLALNNEGYTFSSDENGVRITGKSAHGAFYGMQTLMQLLPAEIESNTVVKRMAWTAPAVDISDEPRFGYRGMHSDVCRHFFDVDYMKKQLDVMALFKLNTLHWHLTDDQGWRIEIKKYPKLTEIGSKRVEGDGSIHEGYFTQEQIREVVQYAADRFIEVIPEIELPGHAVAALTAYPEYSCTGGPFVVRNIWGISEDLLCPGNENTLPFVLDILHEVMELFPGRYIHIGGDECPKVRWDNCPKCQELRRKHGFKNSDQLQTWFMAQVENEVHKYGKRIIGWAEIIDEKGMSPEAIVMTWLNEEGAIKAVNEGHDAIMTPAEPLYLDRYEGDLNVEPVAIGSYETLEKVYNYDPIPEAITPDKQHHILGAQGNVWAEYLHTGDDVEYRAYPRIIALAELSWTPKENKNWTDFERRIENAFVRLDEHGINYHIPLPEGPITETVLYLDSITLPFKNTRNYPMVYTLDGSHPTGASQQYTHPLRFNSDATLRIATLLTTGKLSPVRTIEVKKTELLPASDEFTYSGIRANSAEGVFVTEEEMVAAMTDPARIVRDFTDIRFLENQPSAAIYEGFFEVPEDGIYTFGTDMERLYVDGKLLIDHQGKMRRHLRGKQQIGLKAGKHSFRAIFNNRVIDGVPGAWNRNGFFYQAPHSDEMVRISPDKLSYE